MAITQSVWLTILDLPINLKATVIGQDLGNRVGQGANAIGPKTYTFCSTNTGQLRDDFAYPLTSWDRTVNTKHKRNHTTQGISQSHQIRTTFSMIDKNFKCIPFSIFIHRDVHFATWT